MKTFAQPVRGLVGVRADASTDIKALLDEQGKAFEAFKAAHEKEVSDLKKGMGDVVQSEQVDRINASVGELQTAIDEANAKIASLSLSGGSVDAETDPEYVKAFGNWFRKGRGESEVEAMQATGIRAAMSVGTDADGGYLAPTEWDRTIVDKLKIVSPMRQIAGQISIGGNGFTRLYNDRATASGWVGETAARPTTAQAQLGQLTFSTGEVYANPKATQRVLDDALIDVESWLAMEVETEFAYQENVAFISGNGTNKPNGLLTYATGAANAATHPWGAIPEVVSGAAAAITVDGLIDLVYDLPTERSANARFIMNRKTHAAVRKLKDGDGNLIWQRGLAPGEPSTILGQPVTEMAAMPDVAANAYPIAFGDFQRGYLIVDRVGIRITRDPYTDKPNVQFYTTKRVGGGVNDPQSLRLHKMSV
jgi:HK97 family phage major capsid protein